MFFRWIVFLFLVMLELEDGFNIVCVGDSITYGTGATNMSSRTYPALLSDLLVGATNVSIYNFGVKGASAGKTTDNPYWNTDEFKSAQETQASIVIIQFGANDAKFNNNWIEKDFINDYVSLINVFKQQKEKPKVYICIPPMLLPWYASTKVNSTVINVIYPNIFPTMAQNTNSQLIDLWKIFADNGSEINKYSTQFFCRDGLHPNDRGYEVIAKTIAEVLLADFHH